jgi:hypothetical protein
MSRPLVSYKKPIEHFITVDSKLGCWLWWGATNIAGYAQYRLDEKTRLVHVILWERKNGKVPEGFELDHFKAKEGCPHNCVNPEHCEPVTHRENMRRSKRTILKQNQVVAIKEKLKRYKIVDIAVEYGVKIHVISDISAGRTWRDV